MADADTTKDTAEKAEPKAKSTTRAKRSTTAKAESPKMETYVVTVGALNVTTRVNPGLIPNEITRLLHGALLEADPSDERIKFFLATKSIKKHDPEKDAPLATAAMVTQAFGSEADPALKPRADVQPTTASKHTS